MQGAAEKSGRKARPGLLDPPSISGVSQTASCQNTADICGHAYAHDWIRTNLLDVLDCSDLGSRKDLRTALQACANLSNLLSFPSEL